MSVNDHVLKIKVVSDALGSIGAPTKDDDLVSAVLNGLKHDENWKAFATSMNVLENLLDFDELISLMIIEERNIGGPSSAVRVLMSRHKPSNQVMVEARGDPREDVVQEEVIIRITRITRIIKIDRISRI